ncbi:two-component regulator propeller domain-containing protein [Flavobacterium sp.]|uniref:two-component regulator propeller domain-containing protein n=1 Tax=Flavobacterium sp. TaxID=239 RepID=UPI004048AEF5
MRNSFFLSFLFFICFKLSAQFKISHYNSENGLPHDLCYQIIQDKHGYIWLGTDNGLVKFNGFAFQTFNRNQGLSNSFVIDVFENAENKMVATWGGGLYTFFKDKFTPVLPEKYKLSKIQQIIVSNNKEIFAVENRTKLNVIPDTFDVNKTKRFSLGLDANNLRLLKYEEQIKIKNFKNFNFNLSLLGNKVYLVTDRFTPQFKGAHVFDKGKLENSNFTFLKDYFIIDFKEKNNLYLAVTSNGILYFNANEIVKFEQLGLNEKSIVHYDESQFYKVFGLLNKVTNQHEILIIDKSTNQQILYNNTVIKSLVSDVLISKDESIWVSTYGNGLLLFQKDVLPVNKNSLKGNFVNDYLELQNHNLFLTLENVFCTNKKYEFLDKSNFKFGIAFKDFENNTVKIHTKEPVDFTTELNDYKFKSDFSINHFLWNNTKLEYGDNILGYFQNSIFKKINLQLNKDELNTLKIKKLISYKDRLIVLSNYGIFIINEKFELEKSYVKGSDLLGNEVINAKVKNNKLYLLQYQGIVVFDGEKVIKYEYQNYSNNFFNDFEVTNEGNIWIASQKGLVLFENDIFKLFTKKEGLNSSFYAKIYENQNNELVALGNNGIDIFNATYKPVFSPIQIVLSREGKRLHASDIIEFKTDDLQILNVDIINFNKSKFHVQYQINNQGWRVLTGNTIDLTNYKAGDYVFKIRSKYDYSDWVNQPTYRFVKIPVWYFRWYIYIPLLILSVLIISFLIYKRIVSLKRRNVKLQNLLESNEKLQFQLNEMRHNIAQDFHDELGNKLAGITVLSEKLLSEENADKNKNYPVVERIHKDSQDLFQGIRDFIWAIDSKNGTLEELIFALTDFGEDLFSQTNIKFIVNNQIEEASFLLPNYWNRQLLLLFKEAMTNVYKHSKASRIELVFKLSNSYLSIECVDNGIGFNLNTLKRQNGLNNLNKRALKLKSKLEINSDINKGTFIIFNGEII